MQREKNEEAHANDVQLNLLEKDGDKLLAALEEGYMAAILSEMEIMYIFLDSGFRCYIHPIGSEEGRAKRLPYSPECRSVVKNLANLADHMFKAKPQKGMDVMGIMQAAENGILSFLSATGQMPAEDIDFMDWQNAPAEQAE